METLKCGEPTLFARLAAGWQAIADYFVPTSIAGDRDASNRARMFLISHTIGPVLGNTVPIALFAFDPTPHVDVAILAGAISLFWVFPFLLKAGLRYDRLVLLSVVNLNFCILWSCYHYGGISSPTLTWVLIIPILSLFYIGGETRLQPKLLSVTALAFVVFLAASLIVEAPENDMPNAATLGLGAVSTIATLCYVATMAVYYARVFDAGVDLETEVRRRRQMADELRSAVAEVHRTTSAKSEFLARLSHEIRTPLNAIIGYGEILKEEAEESEDKHFENDVNRILDAAHYLLRLINRILDLAKIEVGRMRFDMHPHRLAPLLEKAVAERSALIDDRANRVSIEIEAGLDLVETDENRLRQVIGCIVDNAAMHTSQGEIRLLATKGEWRGQPAFSISIADTGTGIAPEELPTLFETFATARTAAEGRYGGTGLNLTVCSKLCRAMGGTIAVESTPGEGSRFTVTLPLAGDKPPYAAGTAA